MTALSPRSRTLRLCGARLLLLKWCRHDRRVEADLHALKRRAGCLRRRRRLGSSACSLSSLDATATTEHTRAQSPLSLTKREKCYEGETKLGATKNRFLIPSWKTTPPAVNSRERKTRAASHGKKHNEVLLEKAKAARVSLRLLPAELMSRPSNLSLHTAIRKR